ncbi:hypothetical protein GQ53DRAFT_320296 [Thozetella sp. PMI_491]|nr:hypothetical protein GQ53DRAFT_320296 [Thozetella sp. PMI_491]
MGRLDWTIRRSSTAGEGARIPSWALGIRLLSAGRIVSNDATGLGLLSIFLWNWGGGGLGFGFGLGCCHFLRRKSKEKREQAPPTSRAIPFQLGQATAAAPTQAYSVCTYDRTKYANGRFHRVRPEAPFVLPTNVVSCNKKAPFDDYMATLGTRRRKQCLHWFTDSSGHKTRRQTGAE